jgi:hypothetical protein
MGGIVYKEQGNALENLKKGLGREWAFVFRLSPNIYIPRPLTTVV